MQALKNAVAVFCTACICAEVLTQLLGGTRLRACIKAVAGLYIVVSVLQALPGLGAQAMDFAWPETPAASFGSLEDAVLRQAAQQLAEQLAGQIQEQTGCVVRLEVELEQTQGAVAARAVRVYPKEDCAGRHEQIAALLRQALGTENVVFLNEEDVA